MAGSHEMRYTNRRLTFFYLLKEASIVHVDDDADDGEDTGYWTSGGGGDGEN